MSNFGDLNILKSSCTDEWVAKTYSEYLMTCASDKTRLMDAITEVSVDPVLEQLTDDLNEQCYPLCEYIDTMVIDNISDEYDKSTISRENIYYLSSYLNLSVSNPNFIDTLHQLQTILGYDYNVQTPTQFYEQCYAHQCLDAMICKSPTYQNALDEKVNDKLTELKYNSNTKYTLNAGFVNLKDLFKQVVTHTEIADGGIQVSGYDSQDVYQNVISMSVDDFWNEAKANLISTLAWAQGFASVGLTSVSDRVNNFDASLSTMVTDMGASFAASIANVKSRISSASITVREFLDQAGEALGWSKLKDTNATVNDTDIAAYTGASPLSDLNLNTAKGVLTATARTVVAVGYGLWMGLKSLAKKCWGKIRPYVMAITNNPYDIKKVSDSNAYTIDGWCYNTTQTYDFLAQDIYDTAGSYEAYQDAVNRYIDIVTKNKDKWIKVETIFGEILFKMNSITPSEHIGPMSSLIWVSINVTIQAKPRCLNYHTVGEYLGNISDAAIGVLPYEYSSATHDWENVNVNSPASKIQEFYKSGDMYLDTDAAEAELLMGFNLGMDCMLKAFELSYIEMAQQLSAGGHAYFRHAHAANQAHPYNTTDLLGLFTISEYIDDLSHRTVTNLDFMQGCAGLDKHNSAVTSDWTFDGWYHWYFSTYDHTLNYGKLYQNGVSYFDAYFVPMVLLNILEVFGDKYDNPLDYVYYPYSSDQTDFQQPRFKIKTDAENKNVAAAFYNTLALVALVIIAVAVVGSVAKIAKNASRNRARYAVGQLDAKIWDGEKLSPFENWKYNRKTKKLSKLASSTSGLNSSTSTMESVQKIYDTVTTQFSASHSDSGYLPDGTPALIEPNLTEWEKYKNIYRSITGITLEFN